MVCLGLLLNSSAQAITAKSWIVADYKGKIIDGENINQVRSIASITKLVTVMTVLDAGLDPNEKIKQYTRNELIQLALIRSDNHAADELCNSYPGGKGACVLAMNQKVAKMGLVYTRFIEPTGLSVFNVSTADELVSIVLEAEHYPEIVSASQLSTAKIKHLSIKNTNPLVALHNVVVSKTGYIRASGGCVVMMLDTSLGRRIIVLLGSKNTRTRIPEAQYIASQY
jgi:D-alanyl-D-alanine endopeptidase (penicillin-binding protein 7)